MAFSPVYSKQFYNANFLAGGISIVPVPSGKLWVVRNVQLWLNTTPGITAALELNVDGPTVFRLPLISGLNRPYWFDTRWVVLDQLEIFLGGSAAQVGINISGFELSLP